MSDAPRVFRRLKAICKKDKPSGLAGDSGITRWEVGFDLGKQFPDSVIGNIRMDGEVGAANARRMVAAWNCHDELLGALRWLVAAASCRESTMGDPIRLLDCQRELSEATDAARQAIAEAEREGAT